MTKLILSKQMSHDFDMQWDTVHERRLRLTFTVTMLLKSFARLTLVIDRKEEINSIHLQFF